MDEGASITDAYNDRLIEVTTTYARALQAHGGELGDGGTMDTVETVRLTGAIVVTRDSLEQCNRILTGVVEGNTKSKPRSQGYSVSYSATLADDARVTFDSFEDLTRFPNRRDRRLVSLTAKIEPDFFDDVIRVEIIFGVLWQGTYSATIRGREATALPIKEQCKDLAGAVRASYGWLYNPINYIAIFCLWITVLFASSI